MNADRRTPRYAFTNCTIFTLSYVENLSLLFSLNPKHQIHQQQGQACLDLNCKADRGRRFPLFSNPLFMCLNQPSEKLWGRLMLPQSFYNK